MDISTARTPAAPEKPLHLLTVPTFQVNAPLSTTGSLRGVGERTEVIAQRIVDGRDPRSLVDDRTRTRQELLLQLEELALREEELLLTMQDLGGAEQDRQLVANSQRRVQQWVEASGQTVTAARQRVNGGSYLDDQLRATVGNRPVSRASSRVAPNLPPLHATRGTFSAHGWSR